MSGNSAAQAQAGNGGAHLRVPSPPPTAEPVLVQPARAPSSAPGQDRHKTARCGRSRDGIRREATVLERLGQYRVDGGLVADVAAAQDLGERGARGIARLQQPLAPVAVGVVVGMAVGDPCTDNAAQRDSMDMLWYAHKNVLLQVGVTWQRVGTDGNVRDRYLQVTDCNGW